MNESKIWRILDVKQWQQNKKRRLPLFIWEYTEDNLRENKLYNDESSKFHKICKFHLQFILPVNSVNYKCWNIYKSSSDS